MRDRFSRFDVPLFLAAILLCGIGLLNVYSGTRVVSAPGISLVTKQAVWILMGLALFVAVYLAGDGLLEQIAPYLYGASVLLLAVVLVSGRAHGGAQRWISLGPLNLQPSEFAKLSLILAVARYYAARYDYSGLSLVQVLPAAALAGVPFLLVLLQPDLGTAGVFLLILAAMTAVACLRGRPMALLAGAGLSALPLLWYSMRDYQKQRVLTFLDPERDPVGSGYHIIQSKIAVGSGGLLGKGYLRGTQGSLRFLPEQHTDFAFAVFSEEWGLLGSLVLLGLFLFLIWRGLWLARMAQDRFASIACAGVASYFLSHAAINLAMVCGLFPVVGIPLPFVSYGGSAMLSNMLALGILANLARSRFTFQAGETIRTSP